MVLTRAGSESGCSTLSVGIAQSNKRNKGHRDHCKNSSHRNWAEDTPKKTRLAGKTYVCEEVILITDLYGNGYGGMMHQIQVVFLGGGVHDLIVPPCLTYMLRKGLLYQVEVSYNSKTEDIDDGPSCEMTLVSVIQLLGSCLGFKEMIAVYEEGADDPDSSDSSTDADDDDEDDADDDSDH